MSDDPKLVQDIFLRLIELPPEERAAALERECGADAALRQRVELLLKAHEEPDSFLDQSGDQLAATFVTDADEPHAVQAEETPAEGGSSSLPELSATLDFDSRGEIQAGVVIAGRYALKEKIGEGGMGEVWVAKQSEPVKRKVAVKVIKTGMDSKAVLARFEQERQALAMMDHPNIARVLDGGLTPAGQPFFVMELVNGLQLNEFCDQTKLPLKQRLELFVPICQAVQHAHQKGIVHRDLKPANILVTLVDGRPVPKVIDFGVAKATSGKLTDESLSTQFGAIVGTLEYMSPEQAGYAGDDIDTRADIYSLGVILYELLTGLRPIDAERFKQAAFTEMIRIIREEEPSKPSTRLSTDKSLPTLAAVRMIDPRKLTALLRGELDWIVMKCLEKPRERRYETANALVRDIQRFLADEPVEARPPSAGYRLKKFVRRNKGQVTAAVLVMLALILGIVGTSLGWREAKRQEGLADARRIDAVEAQKAESERAEGERLAKLLAEQKQAEAEKQKQRAEMGEDLAKQRLEQVEAEKKKVEAEKQKAEQEKQIAQALQDFLQNKLLGQADVTAQADALLKYGGLATDAKQNPTIRELLDRATAELSEEKIEANFPNQKLLQAEILHTVGNAYHGIGEYEQAIEFLKRSRQLFEAECGLAHADTLTSMSYLAGAYSDAGKVELALPLFEETLKLTKALLGPDHPHMLISMNNLAGAYDDVGKVELSLPLFEETLKLMKAKLGPDHPETLTTMNNLAYIYRKVGKLDLALPLSEETLKLRKAKLGSDHPHTLISMNALASAYQETGKLDLSLSLFEETLKLRTAKLGPDHPETLNSMNNLALAYQDAGKLGLALPLYAETLKLMKAKLGSDHPDTLVSMNNLAMAYEEAGKLDLALPLLAKQSSLNPKDTSLTMKVSALEAWFHRDEEFAANAERALRFAKGSKDPTVGERTAKVCCLYPSKDKARLAAALELARFAVERGKNHDGLPDFQMALGMAEYRNGNFPAAETALLAAGKGQEKHPHLGCTSGYYRAMSQFRQGKNAEARKLALATVPNMKPLPENEQNPLANNANADDLIVWLAYKEAQALIGFATSIKPAIAEK